ncbi:hypothetical protein AB835_00640 [Candidatus Endobugula sertula]|uniref:AAA+ ATPase domain-containing protein n=1 Tax=Candidatus Endobugula sertula TaxID=62101 RepID=A0A1D2QTZ3_9GAMM|nr:hypothetical protein AB835_00640 [Candidatus Endobugula sertula]
MASDIPTVNTSVDLPVNNQVYRVECSVLEKEVAIMAGRLAALLSQRFSQEISSITLPLKFLDFRYKSIFGDTPIEYWSEDCRERIVSAKVNAGQKNHLSQLIHRLNLSLPQIDMLLMAGLAEEHEGFADIFRSLHPSGLPRPTMGLLAQLTEAQYEQRNILREIISTSKNKYLSIFIEDEEQPFFTRSLCLIDGLWPWLHGIDVWPEVLSVVDYLAVMVGLDHWLEEPEIKNITQHLRQFSTFSLLLTGEHMNSAVNRAAALCRHAGVNYCLVQLNENLKKNALTLLQIHCLIRNVVPIIQLELLSSSEAEKGNSNNDVLDFTHFFAPAIFCSDNHQHYKHNYINTFDQRPIQCLQIKTLNTSSLRSIWRTLLPELAADTDQLAARYPFEPDQVQAICADVRHLCVDYRNDNSNNPTLSTISLSSVATAVRSRSGTSLAGGLQLIHPIADWSQLILPQLQLSQLRDAANRLSLQSRVLDDWKFLVGKRGARGVRMLFSGPPGTGKTLSAEVMAKALGVELLQVDLSRVVSKWVRETEKNLADVFNTAESTRAVLFFDEADALFGKRTEVSDAHDRYANLETSYLLSRLERYDGLAILATNYRQNIDTAFCRRLEFIVEFEEPGVDERLKLWQCHIPDTAPLDTDVNLSELAMLFPIVGGHIRNAAVSAAFLAAQDRRKINRQHFMISIKREYEKSGKAYREIPRR